MTEGKPQVLLKHYLKKLKLPTLLRDYEAVAATCAQDNCDYVTFLLRLVEREALDREKRSAERRGIWSSDVLVDECKVLVLVSEDPFFDEGAFFKSLQKSFQNISGRENSNISFFAEKFGYRRFSISYETDNLTQMRITQALFDLELDETRELIGPAPEMKLPLLPGIR